jgi:NAD(P)-dependent dehydrogenase (short-subunit alcohol dehydrogenase family)
MTGLHYAGVDVGDDAAVARATPAFDRLDVLVQCQGTVLYDRQEFHMPGFRKVLDVNLMSIMACAEKFHLMLAQAKGALIIVSSRPPSTPPRATRPIMRRRRARSASPARSPTLSRATAFA